jgi:hypothetical protein
MPLYLGRAKSKFGPGYNGSERSVIIQKEEKISGPPNPRSNIFPIFEKMSHNLFLQESNFIKYRSFSGSKKRDSESTPPILAEEAFP